MRTGFRSRCTALVLFAAGILVASVTQAEFRSYRLLVYCKPEVATATFWHDVNEPGTMGLKSICAGSCPGGTVTIADALAGLPAEARAGLTARVEAHEGNVAAGKGRSLAGCLNPKSDLRKSTGGGAILPPADPDRDGLEKSSGGGPSAGRSPVRPPASSPQLAYIIKSDGEKAGLSVEVTELKRGSDGTVTLKFAMVNNTKEQIRFGGDYGAGGGNVDDNTVSGTHLIDAVNKKKYLVVRDSARKCVCSVVKSAIPVGERMDLWAKFPAPPEDVKVISVMIPHFPPMDDVPISP